MLHAAIRDDIEVDMAGASHLLGDNFAARAYLIPHFIIPLSLLHALKTI
jgi:hypothetical protein